MIRKKAFSFWEDAAKSIELLIIRCKTNPDYQNQNHIVKRFDLDHILGKPVLESTVLPTPNEHSPAVVEECNLPYLSTRKGIFLISLNGVSISSSGDRIWGFYIFKDIFGHFQYKLVMHTFTSNEELVYDYEHIYRGFSVVASEDLNLVMTGAWDGKTVLHNLTSGPQSKCSKGERGVSVAS